MAADDEVNDAELQVSEDHVEDTNNDGDLGVGGGPTNVKHFDSDAYGEKLHKVVGPDESPLNTEDGFEGVSPEYQGNSEVRTVGPDDAPGESE